MFCLGEWGLLKYGPLTKYSKSGFLAWLNALRTVGRFYHFYEKNIRPYVNTCRNSAFYIRKAVGESFIFRSPGN